MNEFVVKGEVKMFPGPAAWIYVDVPKGITEILTDLGRKGLIPVDAKLRLTKWQTAVLPKGDGHQFIPLKKEVRKAEEIEVGDEVTVTFGLLG